MITHSLIDRSFLLRVSTLNVMCSSMCALFPELTSQEALVSSTDRFFYLLKFAFTRIAAHMVAESPKAISFRRIASNDVVTSIICFGC